MCSYIWMWKWFLPKVFETSPVNILSWQLWHNCNGCNIFSRTTLMLAWSCTKISSNKITERILTPPPPNIPVVQKFKYLGISIFSSLQATASHNFHSMLGQVEADLNWWTAMPNTLQARIVVVKMNILPRVYFCSYMLPLPPPKGYWDKLHKLVSYYVWNGKRQCMYCFFFVVASLVLFNLYY